MPLRARREGDKIVIENGGVSLTLSLTEAYHLVREVGKLLGLRVTLGRPIVSYHVQPTHYSVIVIEGQGARSFAVPKQLVNAFIRAAQKLGVGKHDKREFARVAFEEASKAGVPGVRRYLSGNGIEWELLLGNRQDYYDLFRAPALLLEEMGMIEVGGRKVKVKSLTPRPRGRTLLQSLGGGSYP